MLDWAGLGWARQEAGICCEAAGRGGSEMMQQEDIRQDRTRGGNEDKFSGEKRESK